MIAVTTPESPYAPATPEYAKPAPVTPTGTDQRSVVLTATLAAALLLAAVVNIVGGTGFPSNAPVEQIWNFGITVDLFAGAVALFVRFLAIRKRPQFDARAVAGVSPLALTAVIISGAVLLGWLVLGGIGFIGSLVTGGADLRYYMDTNGAFFLGIPWMLGLFFGVSSLRQGKGTPTTASAWVAIGISLFIVAASLFSAVIYGLGLSA
jgi:hypothetical protein